MHRLRSPLGSGRPASMERHRDVQCRHVCHSSSSNATIGICRGLLKGCGYKPRATVVVGTEVDDSRLFLLVAAALSPHRRMARARELQPIACGMKRSTSGVNAERTGPSRSRRENAGGAAAESPRWRLGSSEMQRPAASHPRSASANAIGYPRTGKLFGGSREAGAIFSAALARWS